MSGGGGGGDVGDGGHHLRLDATGHLHNVDDGLSLEVDHQRADVNVQFLHHRLVPEVKFRRLPVHLQIKDAQKPSRRCSVVEFYKSKLFELFRF